MHRLCGGTGFQVVASGAYLEASVANGRRKLSASPQALFGVSSNKTVSAGKRS